MKTVSSIKNQSSQPASRGSAFGVLPLHQPLIYESQYLQWRLYPVIIKWASTGPRLNKAGDAKSKLLRQTTTIKPLSTMMPSFRWMRFAATCHLCAITYHLPPVCGRWQTEWTDGQIAQSITALTSAWTRRTSQNICMSLSLENNLWNHSASGNRTRCLRNPAITGGWRDFFF